MGSQVRDLLVESDLSRLNRGHVIDFWWQVEHWKTWKPIRPQTERKRAVVPPVWVRGLKRLMVRTPPLYGGNIVNRPPPKPRALRGKDMHPLWWKYVLGRRVPRIEQDAYIPARRNLEYYSIKGVRRQLGPVAQMVSALACHARGRGFESRLDR